MNSEVGERNHKATGGLLNLENDPLPSVTSRRTQYDQQLHFGPVKLISKF